MRSASRSSSVITVKSSVDAASRPSSGAHGRGDPVLISLRSGQPGTVRAISTPTVPSAPQVDVAHHAQVDDRAVQLGVLHRAERFDDLLGGRHGAPRPCPRCSPVGITTTAIGRIPGWPCRTYRYQPDDDGHRRAHAGEPGRVLCRGQRHHQRLRRPDAAGHLPARPRGRRGRGHGRAGGRALRAAPQRRPPPPGQAGRRRLPRGGGGQARVRRGSPVQALPGQRRAPLARRAGAGRRPRPDAPRPGAGPPARGPRPSSWRRRWARSTAGPWPPG